jgi:hypothetical protein
VVSVPIGTARESDAGEPFRSRQILVHPSVKLRCDTTAGQMWSILEG